MLFDPVGHPYHQTQVTTSQRVTVFSPILDKEGDFIRISLTIPFWVLYSLVKKVTKLYVRLNGYDIRTGL